MNKPQPPAGGYVDAVRGDVLAWLEALRDKSGPWGRWRYHSGMAAPSALQATAIALQVLDLLGALHAVPAAQRAEAADHLLSCQDAADGLFKDPLETEARHVGPHTWEQIWGQRHGATVTALELLGVEPRYPLPRAQFADLGAVDAAAWTLSLDWQNPWRYGETWSRALHAYFAARGADPKRYAEHPNILAAFDAMEREILDPATGTPCRRMSPVNPAVAMAGLFKVMFGYLEVGRPVPHAAAGIDSTLRLEHPDSDWGSRRNMCMVWDALWVLYPLDRQLNGAHRHADIVAAGNRTAAMLLRDYRKPDGGFAFNGEHAQCNHHSIHLCDAKLPIGDMLGTRMALHCLAYIDEWNAGAAR